MPELPPSAEPRPASAPTDAAEVAALRRRLAELEALELDRLRALKVEDALYRNADTAGSIHEMTEFYPAMHAIVGELMNAQNFYIALYDEARHLLNYPYYVDELDPDVPDPAVWEPMGTGWGGGVTAYSRPRGGALAPDPGAG